MDSRASLTVRTVAALQRLADLEQRGRSLPGAKASVLKTALRELERALQELRVASEQLNAMVDETARARSDAQRVEAEFDEFRDRLPLACVRTDRDGTIQDANTSAGDLLNVAPRHLVRKQLSLYIVERDRFFGMMNGTRSAADSVQGALAIRPRERKPRNLRVHVAQTSGGDQLYWFFQEQGGGAAASE